MSGTRPVVLAVVLTTACSHGAMAQDPGTLAASASGVTLGAGPTEVTLGGASEGGAPTPVAARLKNVEAGRQIYLTFTRAQAPAAPGITYNVYLGLPANTAPPGTSDSHYVGTLSFFSAIGRPLDMSLNITSHVGRLLASSEIGDDIRVTIVPAGEPAAAPQVARIAITVR